MFLCLIVNICNLRSKQREVQMLCVTDLDPLRVGWWDYFDNIAQWYCIHFCQWCFILITNNRSSIALSNQCENLVRVCCELASFWWECAASWPRFGESVLRAGLVLVRVCCELVLFWWECAASWSRFGITVLEGNRANLFVLLLAIIYKEEYDLWWFHILYCLIVYTHVNDKQDCYILWYSVRNCLFRNITLDINAN